MKAIIHCSMSNYGNAALIDKWHRERGFDKIGYHFVILNGKLKSSDSYNKLYDGIIETGRETTEKGAHCYGYNNYIGICLIGQSEEFTIDQLTNLKRIITANEFEEIYQHSDFDDKKSHCAGLSNYIIDNLRHECIENNRLRKLVNKEIKEYVENNDHGNIYTHLEFAKHGRHKCNI